MVDDTADLAKREGFTPAELLYAIETYRFNLTLFHGPGAIAFYVRNRQWPVEGVRDPQKARAAELARADHRREDQIQREIGKFIRWARKEGKPDDWIDDQ